MKPTFAVLIPTRNRRDLLKRALASVFNQTSQPDEVIVIDDNSSDGTKDFLKSILHKYKSLKIIFLEKNGGVNFARNQGMKKSKSDWIIWLDDDDELVVDAIVKIRENIQNFPQGFDVALFNSLIDRGHTRFDGGFQFGFLDKDFYDPSYEEVMTKFNLKGDSKPVLRRSLFKNHRYDFPESVNGFESYTLNIIAKDKKGIRYFKDQTTLIHQEPEVGDRLSISASIKNPWPLFVLHLKQIFQHARFYLGNPVFFVKKLKEMAKLLIRSFFKIF